MTSRSPQVERVPLTEAEVEHLAPIADRFQQAQREYVQAQRDVEAVVKLYRAQHKDELREGPEWNLDRDAFVRSVVYPAVGAAHEGPKVEQPINGDGPLEMEKQFAEIMER